MSAARCQKTGWNPSRIFAVEIDRTVNTIGYVDDVHGLFAIPLCANEHVTVGGPSRCLKKCADVKPSSIIAWRKLELVNPLQPVFGDFAVLLGHGLLSSVGSRPAFLVCDKRHPSIRSVDPTTVDFISSETFAAIVGRDHTADGLRLCF